jgi:ABC-2 type transport system ATP-binding protein
MSFAIETFDLSKTFPAPRRMRLPWHAPDPAQVVHAVREVSLAVEEGELFGLLGPNGAGKTTLVKVLCTLISPTSGSARLGGYDLSDTVRVRQTIGLAVGDERSFYWRLTGWQNLEFYAALYGLSPGEARARIRQVLAWLELTDQADHRFHTYSSGQKQRFAIARAVLHRPRILFMDEPTRSLDPTTTEHLHHFIAEELIRREGMTVFLTTHRLDEAEKLCRRVAIMDRGRIRACGRLAELRASLGPQTRYRLRLHGLSEGSAEVIRTALGEKAALTSDRQGAIFLTLETTSGEEALARAIGLVYRLGAEVREVTQEEMPLAEVFRRFTSPSD